MSNSDLNKIKAELDKIYREFKDFQTTINDLLSKHSSDSASSTITRGAMTSAGANAEIILKYILDKEGIAVIKNRGKQAIDQNPNKPATLDDYIILWNLKVFYLKKYVITLGQSKYGETTPLMVIFLTK